MQCIQLLIPPPGAGRFAAQFALNHLRRTAHSMRKNHAPPGRSFSEARLEAKRKRNSRTRLAHGVTQNMLRQHYDWPNTPINRNGKLPFIQQNLWTRWPTFTKLQKAFVLVHQGAIFDQPINTTRGANITKGAMRWRKPGVSQVDITLEKHDNNTYSISGSEIENPQPDPSRRLYNYIMRHAHNVFSSNENLIALRITNHQPLINILIGFNHATLNSFFTFLAHEPNFWQNFAIRDEL